jgi:hypothetical protein
MMSSMLLERGGAASVKKEEKKEEKKGKAKEAPAKALPAADLLKLKEAFDQFDEVAPTGALQVSTYDKVRSVMKEGGVWTLAAMFEEVFPGRTRGDGLADYNAVSAAMRKMFADNECSKFSFWRTSEQVKPGRDWFTCYPDRADVDEWEA